MSSLLLSAALSDVYLVGCEALFAQCCFVDSLNKERIEEPVSHRQRPSCFGLFCAVLFV